MAKTIIVVELGLNTLTAVELMNQHTSIELVRFTRRELPVNGVSSSWLKTVWNQEHLSQRKVVCCLAPGLVKYKAVTLPNLPLEQLEAAVRMELDNSSSDHDSIYKIINCQPQNQMVQIKVAVIKNSELTQHLFLFQEAGLEVAWSGIRVRGVQNFINFNYNFLDDPSAGAGFFEITEAQTEFGVINGEAIVYNRDFTPGLLELKGPDKTHRNDFLDEVRLSIASYKAAQGNPVTGKVWFLGEVETIPDLIGQISEQLELQTYIPNHSRLTGVIADKYIPVLAPLIGLGLDELGWSRQESLRIYSSAQNATRMNRGRIWLITKIGFLFLGVGGGLLLGLQAQIERTAKVNQWLAGQSAVLRQLQRTEANTGQNLQKIKMMESWLAQRGQELEFLLALQAALPEDTRITDILIESGQVKDLAGITPSVSFLLAHIKTVPMLEKMKLKGTINVNENGELFHLEGSIQKGSPK